MCPDTTWFDNLLPMFRYCLPSGSACSINQKDLTHIRHEWQQRAHPPPQLKLESELRLEFEIWLLVVGGGGNQDVKCQYEYFKRGGDREKIDVSAGSHCQKSN